jgi:VIT1/CCC1 family predicted Fe2+/Mn2+ transporter
MSMSHTQAELDFAMVPRVKAKRPPAIERAPRPLGVVAQVRRACARGNRLAAFVGMLLGGFVPLAVYVVAHNEAVPLSSITFGTSGPWALVFGGLAYSAKTVFAWGKLAFESAFKATGFVVLVEGVAVTSHTQWLGLAALGYLVLINGVATACTLSGQR